MLIRKTKLIKLVLFILFLNLCTYNYSLLEARRVRESPSRLISDYAAIVGQEYIDSLISSGQELKGKNILELNSVSQGGGVAEILNVLVPLFDQLGLRAERGIFEVEKDKRAATIIKNIFNAFQGKRDVALTTEDLDYLESVAGEFVSSFGDFSRYDAVVVHDGVIVAVPIIKRALLAQGKPIPKFIWRVHYDSSQPSPVVDEFVNRYGSQADHIIYSMPDYIIEGAKSPYSIINPAIDPLSDKNKPLSQETVRQTITEYGVDSDRPILLQVSRFDYFKDPIGVIKVYRIAKEKIKDLQLVLIGSPAGDDPEGEPFLEAVKAAKGDDADIHIITEHNNKLVNAFQRGATVVIQKSLRESFGLVVTEAMWKSNPVVGSNVGGISYQINDNVTGFLREPNDIAGFAEKIVFLIENPRIRKDMGSAAHEFVKENFLITALLKARLELFKKLFSPP